MIDIQLQERSQAGPVYLQIRTQIETLIKDRQIASGEALPSPVALAQKLATDKGEVQRAYYELEVAGLVSTRKTKDFLGKEKVTYTVR